MRSFCDGWEAKAQTMNLKYLLISVHVWLARRAAGMEILHLF